MALRPNDGEAPARHDREADASEHRDRESPMPLLGLTLGPAAWALQHTIGYAMIPWLCDMGQTWPYHALIGACIVLCCVGAIAARAASRSARRARSKRSADRLRFMARGGYILSGGAVAAILPAYGGAVWIGLCTGQ